MFCPKCGSELREGASFCPKCGTKIENRTEPAAAPVKKVPEFQEIKKNLPEMKIEEMDNRSITISVGVALAPDNGNTFIELYRHADQALYETKRGGRNGYSIYNPNWTENTTEE